MDRGARRLQSIGSQRVGHNWSNLPCTHAYSQVLMVHSVLLISSPSEDDKYGKLAFRLNLQQWECRVFFSSSFKVSVVPIPVFARSSCRLYWVGPCYSVSRLSEWWLFSLHYFHAPLFRVFWWCPIFLIAVSMVSSYGPSRPPQASYFLYGLSSPGEPQLCLVHASLFQSVIPSPSTDSNFKPQFKPRDLFSPKLSASYFLYHIYHRLLCYSWSKFVNSGKPFLPVAHCSTSKNLGFYPNLAIYPSSVAKFPHTKSKNILKQAL